MKSVWQIDGQALVFMRVTTREDKLIDDNSDLATADSLLNLPEHLTLAFFAMRRTGVWYRWYVWALPASNFSLNLLIAKQIDDGVVLQKCILDTDKFGQ